MIVEPVAGNMGCVRAHAPISAAPCGELTQRHGALLIFDEVMTGFRVAYGGAQSLLGIEPDLTTLGKIIGGGLPVGAYGGRAEIMDHVLPAGKVFQAGTLSGNPLATAAGIATLDDAPRQQPLSAAGAAFRPAGRTAWPRRPRRPACRTRSAACGSMLTLFFSPAAVADWDTAARCDTQRYARYFWGMIERGVYLPCSQFEACSSRPPTRRRTSTPRSPRPRKRWRR